MFRLSGLTYLLILALAILPAASALHAERMSSDSPSDGQRLTITVDETEYHFRWVPGGTFAMGSPPTELGRWSDETLHSATVGGLWVAETETTKKQFADFVADTGYETNAEKSGGSYAWTGTTWEKEASATWRSGGGDDFPVVHMSWNDATAFAEWLSKKSGMTVRLPTEAEWEHAARGGTTTATYIGDLTATMCEKTDLEEIAWCCGNSDWSWQPVGQKRANLWWLHDMIGNVWEWTSSTGAWTQNVVDDKPLLEPGDSVYIIRGGSWFTEMRNCRAAMRKAGRPMDSVSDVGFRVVMELQKPKTAAAKP